MMKPRFAVTDFFRRLKTKDDISPVITNLIDVIFILLIFFMVSTQFKKNSFEMNLPQIDEKSNFAENANTNIFISVTETQIDLNGKKIAEKNLQDELLKIVNADSDEDLLIVFSGDKDISYERFLSVYKKIENAGIKKIAIEYDTLDN